MIISIEAIKKPEGANKAQELAAMEEALKKATAEAHKQRVELSGDNDSSSTSFVQGGSVLQNKALTELK
jgi:biopolymer transport protein ExbD